MGPLVLRSGAGAPAFCRGIDRARRPCLHPARVVALRRESRLIYRSADAQLLQPSRCVRSLFSLSSTSSSCVSTRLSRPLPLILLSFRSSLSLSLLRSPCHTTLLLASLFAITHHHFPSLTPSSFLIKVLHPPLVSSVVPRTSSRGLPRGRTTGWTSAAVQTRKSDAPRWAPPYTTASSHSSSSIDLTHSPRRRRSCVDPSLYGIV